MCEVSGTGRIWVRPTSGIPDIHVSHARVYTANVSARVRACVCVSAAGMCQGIRGLKERRLNVVRVLGTTVAISDFIGASRTEWVLESESSMETLESQRSWTMGVLTPRGAGIGRGGGRGGPEAKERHSFAATTTRLLIRQT